MRGENRATNGYLGIVHALEPPATCSRPGLPKWVPKRAKAQGRKHSLSGRRGRQSPLELEGKEGKDWIPPASSPLSIDGNCCTVSPWLSPIARGSPPNDASRIYYRRRETTAATRKAKVSGPSSHPLTRADHKISPTTQTRYYCHCPPCTNVGRY